MDGWAHGEGGPRGWMGGRMVRGGLGSGWVGTWSTAQDGCVGMVYAILQVCNGRVGGGQVMVTWAHPVWHRESSGPCTPLTNKSPIMRHRPPCHHPSQTDHQSRDTAPPPLTNGSVSRSFGPPPPPPPHTHTQTDHVPTSSRPPAPPPCKQITYQEALAACFVEGWIFLIIAVTGLRGRFISLVPKSVMLATASGIGLYLAFVGMQASVGIGLITADQTTLLTLGTRTRG